MTKVKQIRRLNADGSPRWYSAKALATATGVDSMTIERWCRLGLAGKREGLKCTRHTNEWRIYADEAERVFASRESTNIRGLADMLEIHESVVRKKVLAYWLRGSRAGIECDRLGGKWIIPLRVALRMLQEKQVAENAALSKRVPQTWADEAAHAE